MNKLTFQTEMLKFSEMYKTELSKALTMTYWDLLKGLTDEQFQSASRAHMSDTDHGMYFPKPANFLRHIFGDSKTRESEALEAWGELTRQLSLKNTSVGPRTLSAIQSMGGINTLKYMTTKELGFQQRDFVSNYAAIVKSELPAIANTANLMIEKA